MPSTKRNLLADSDPFWEWHPAKSTLDQSFLPPGTLFDATVTSAVAKVSTAAARDLALHQESQNICSDQKACQASSSIVTLDSEGQNLAAAPTPPTRPVLNGSAIEWRRR
mmetsp:Transcript_74097/g.163628  ORF Transcript_74097/g.163628 Transcript_74097/m.163628 type:complete len:110 (+) Transcript_74097:134-463(+)